MRGQNGQFCLWVFRVLGMIDPGATWQLRAQTAGSTRVVAGSRRSACLRHFSASLSFRPGSDGPDGVKCVLVEREQPARWMC